MTAALMIVYERRMLALWQDRYGPNRVGWQGSLQLVADMLKIFLKKIDTQLCRQTPIYPRPCHCHVWCFGIFCHHSLIAHIGAVDWNIGILFFFAMAGLAVYAVMFGGWACQ